MAKDEKGTVDSEGAQSMLNQVTDGGILGHTELALQPRRQSGYCPMCSGRHSPATAQPAALTHTTADAVSYTHLTLPTIYSV